MYIYQELNSENPMSDRLRKHVLLNSLVLQELH